MIATLREVIQIPIESELEERLDWFIRLRWVAAAVILIGGWASVNVLGIELTALPLYGVGLAVSAYNSVFLLARDRIKHRLRRLKSFVFIQIGLDWLALIVLVYYAGGVESPVALAFTFHLIIGAILLSKASCYFLAASAGALLGVVASLEGLGILNPPMLIGVPGLSDSTLNEFFVWLGLTTFFLVTAYLATSITARLREKEEALSESERALDQAYHEMEALYQLGKVVNSTLDIKEVLGLIAKHAARLLEVKACFIRLFDPSGKRLFIGGSYGLSDAYLNKGPVELEKSQIDSETLAGGVVQSLDVGADPRFQYRDEARREGLRSVLCVPLVAKDRSIGVIRVYTAIPHRFSEQEINLLKNLANLGAIAIVNARSYAELGQAVEQKIWFARMTHHQLRAPLAAVQSVLDALGYAGALTAKQRELVNRGRRRLTDAFDTIRDLLDLAAAERPLDVISGEPVIFSEAVARAVEVAGERAKSKGVHLRVELPDDQLVVNSQSIDLDRIFSNLLDNAIKYTRPGGVVSFEVMLEDHTLRAEIRDTGMGIDPSDRVKIFEGFYRTKKAKESGEIGTGLGLSIVKKLVERWEGEVNLESKPDQGSCFTIRLPLIQPTGQ